MKNTIQNPIILVCLSFCGMTNSFAQSGINFDGTNDYITHGSASGLQASAFTVETWFKRSGTGISVSTGTGGLTAIPLVTKGRGEADGNTKDCNYFLGIDAATNVLAADFEEGTGQPSPGLNHPVKGITTICNNVWYHAAVTYNGNTWNLYLNGKLEKTLVVGRLPQSLSIQHSGIGTALNSTGVAAGYFAGIMDEVRIWNSALSQSTIQANMTLQINSAAGLLGHWGMNEGTGTTTANSGTASSVTGTLTNGPVWVSGTTFSPIPSSGNASLYFGGTNAYVTFGNVSGLGLSQFTVETWFRKEGAGSTASSGSGGVSAIPLLTKGRSEADGSTKDCNYFLGIDGTTGKLAGDFEEGTGSASPGLNHPIFGTTVITSNVWLHAALTYDGSVFKIYLNGNLENTITVNRGAQSASIQHAALGSALNSTGSPAGYFNGSLDEARIWNNARSQASIQSTMSQQLNSPQTGMVARWGLNEACGTAVKDSSGNAKHGTITGANWYWNSGAPMTPPVINNPPAQPIVVSPLNNATGVPTSASLNVSVSDPEATALTVAYYARPCPPAPAADFTVIVIPDTQYYTGLLYGGTNEIYKSQMNWIVSHLVSDNIVFVEGVGDCVQNGDAYQDEWKRADTSVKIIENPATTQLPYGIPFGMNVGNHDQSPVGNPNGTTTYFNQYFGSARFNGRPYYGGYYGSSNDNNYCLFSAGGMDFIVINFEYSPTQDAAVLSWANNLLLANSNRRAILGSHYFINADSTWGTQGSVVYNMAKTNPNVFLMLCGHVDEESKRTDVYQNNVITTLLSDYQARTNGGNGWMRIMRFSPSNNTISVKTFSPWLNQYETDANSQFTINYNMTPAAQSYSLIGTNTNVLSGSASAMPYGSLALNTCYQWYTTVSDGVNMVTSPVSTFTTVTAAARNAGEDFSDENEIVGSMEELNVFPNPSRDGIFNISFDETLFGSQIDITNSIGDEIYNDLLAGENGLKQIDLRKAKPGIYFLRIQGNDVSMRRKIVVE
ncbi:MAG: T9SS type A sorting domain-containing protein [Bacteroidetes bacterium]|nr:T9SS type A sorting domain-containing protein [Bacteroidota bacterium]